MPIDTRYLGGRLPLLKPDELAGNQAKLYKEINQEAQSAFGQAGLVNMMYLIGIYLFTCALLNSFEIPVPYSLDARP